MGISRVARPHQARPSCSLETKLGVGADILGQTSTDANMHIILYCRHVSLVHSTGNITLKRALAVIPHIKQSCTQQLKVQKL